MTVTPTTFKNKYTEFSSVTDARVLIFIDDAALEMNEGQWGDLYDRGHAALTAHMLSIAEREALASGSGTAAVGSVSGRTVGSVSVTFATPQISGGSVESYYLSTSYGAEYWRLVQLVGLGILAVTEES